MTAAEIWTWLTTAPLGMSITGGVVVAIIVGIGALIKKLVFKADPPPVIALSTDAQLAKDLGVTETALRNFFKILNDENTHRDDLDAKLREIAARHIELLERVATIPDTGENPDALRDEAKAAIADGRYDDADDILRRAEEQDVQSVAQLEDELRTRYMAAAASAMARGELAFTRFKYTDAAAHYLRAAERYPGDAVEERIHALNWAGGSYREGAAFAPAEDAYTRARSLAEAELPADAPLIATVLSNLATLYHATDRLSKAEPLMERALDIDEAAFGGDHPNVAIRLNNLAQLYQTTNRLIEAEPLMKRALAIDEAAFGGEHPEVAIDLNNLARLYHDTDRLDEAEPLMKRALAIDEAAFGGDHPMVAIRLNNLAGLYQDTNRLSDAEPLFGRAVGIVTQSLGPDHPRTKLYTQNLAILRAQMGAK